MSLNEDIAEISQRVGELTEPIRQRILAGEQVDSQAMYELFRAETLALWRAVGRIVATVERLGGDG